MESFNQITEETLNDVPTNCENTQKTKTENVEIKLQESEDIISYEDNHFSEKVTNLSKEDLNCMKKRNSKDENSSDLHFSVKKLSVEEVQTELEITHLKEELEKVSEQLKKEKHDNTALKVILKQNNDGFKKIQDLYIQEIKMLQSVLNRKQIQQLHSIKLKKEKQYTSLPNDPKENMSERPLKYQDVHRNQSYSPLLRKFDDCHQNIPKNSSLPSNLNKIGLHNHTDENKKFRSIGNLSLNNPEDDNLYQPSEKLSANTSSESVTNSDMKEKDVMTESVEKTLQKELEQLKFKLSQPCEMCSNYEIQLQQKQKLEQHYQKEFDKFQQIQEQYKQDLQKEQVFRTEIEQTTIELAKNSEKEIIELLKRLDSNEKFLIELKSEFSLYKETFQEQLKHLCNFIEELKAELAKLTMENDILVGKHITKAQELLQENIDMPNELEEIQFYCLKLREELITSLINKDTIENNLKSELLFINDQMKAEQYSKELLIKELTQENDNLHTQIVNFGNMKKHYQEELEKLLEKENEFSNLKAQFQLAHQKILDQERMLGEYSIMKENSEMQVQLLKSNIQNLQFELENRELVQKDLVKLTQSLQVELENIRQSNNEVRWQHEGDVSDCLACKLVFHSSKEKVHCSHCGKIFCNNCCSKVVHGGPRNRPFNVCATCYSLLDQESVPYFSSEALASCDQ